MSEPKIRLIALCVFTRGDRILVAEGTDPVKGEAFYRPLGGGVEFGERGEETVVRELMEEIGAEVRDAWYLGTLENIFVYRGRPSHEVALVYDGRFADESLYEQPLIEGIEADGEPIRAVWKSLSEFGEGCATPLYPAGLLERLLRK
ncbi:MAG: NUDIX hydrolase [Blastocatellia bacterium]|nr:NUDIX hydrolase [Blastocatellia bacterium]